MSKIALTPNATGTGVFTISSPATNTNRTLTLPDEAGTVLTSASSLASDNLTGPINVNASAPNQAVTLDSSGNLLVGTTDTTPFNNNAGTSADFGFVVNKGGGYTSLASYNTTPLYINRTSSDGDIVQFRKDGTTVGSIGVASSVPIFNTSTSTGALGVGGTRIYQWDSSQFYPLLDNSKDVGAASYRFDDIYATNGTIQTSDRNEKQDIEALSDAEQRVAVACKGLLRKFRWIDAVAEKGDDARIHFGIIAQDLQDAFAAEGLDAGRYAMFISSTWWETDRVVPAVEAVEGAEATYDDEGNQLTEAVEAVVAVSEHTVTDHYDTLEEAPEGATERTRLGVRYPELLAFIIGAL
jgi:hypothetical protein